MGDAEKSDPQVVRFRAFVSYSHTDATIAQKLHRKIETYRLPHHLRDRETDDPDNGRMGRIFRDREDLPAAEDLSESVKQALAGSQVLVVICSPDAQASIWVAREIELFRALHPGRPVLAALVRGEPEQAFPEALLHGAEPLAADLRKQGDGWRLGFLKIVAGIAGVPLDALVQRDASRRIRRVMAVTGGALVALLAMIGMTIFALQSRNEAQHQQAEAEGLVEYMLTDLRTELKGVGRLDVMTKVNERAMDYYEDQGDLSDMPAESLERRARILHAMGEDDEKRGDLDKALAKFTEAHRVTEALLARDPDNPDRIFGHAQSEYWVGRIYELEKEVYKSQLFYQNYQKAAGQLYKLEGDTYRAIMEKAWGHLNVGIILFKQPAKIIDSRSQFEIAIKWFAKAKTHKDENQETAIQLANAYSWLADTYYVEGNFQRSFEFRTISFSIKNELFELNSNDLNMLYLSLIERRALAIHQEKLSNFERAQSEIRKIKIEAKELLNADQENEEWRGLYFSILSDLDRMSAKKGSYYNVSN